jgi:hypothetical protein
MPKSNIMPNQSLIKGNIFKTAARGQAADKPINPRCNCEARAKMLVVTRPRVVRLRIEAIFKPRNQSSV